MVVESGNLAHTYGSPPNTTELEAVGQAMKLIGYDAVGVGVLDRQFGDDYYKVLKSKGIAVVDTDIEDHKDTVPYTIKTIDGVKVGIISFGFIDPSKADNFALFKKRYKAYEEARKNSDVLVVLDQGDVTTDDWLKRNESRLGAPDIIVGNAARRPMPEPRMVGQTMIVPTTTKGLFINRIDIDIVNGQKKLTFSRAQIDSTIKDDPDVLKIAKDFEATRTVPTESSPAEGAQLATYFTFQSCRGCHTAEYNQWKSTPHAKALKTLIDQQKVLTDCLTCHSEMYRKTQRVTVLDDQIGGVECASCHADVVPHGANFKKTDDSKTAIQEKCLQCHTKDRSPKFDANTWYEMVKHGN